MSHPLKRGPGRRSARARFAAITVVAAVAACGVSACGNESSTEPANVDTFPDGPITVLVGTPPGSVNDTSARTIAPLLEKELDTDVVVKNVEGAGGVAAVDALLKAPADGQTLLTASPTLLTLPSEPSANFTIAEDIQPVAIVGVVPFIVVVPANSPFKTLNDLIAYAKANPGKLKLGGVFPIGNHRMHWELFEDATGIDATYVPFDGGAEADAAVAGGKIEAETSVSPLNIAQLVKAGKVRALAVSTAERIKQLPDVPTYKELGIDFVRDTWDAVVTKRGVPKEIVTKLADAYHKAIQTPEWQEYMRKQAAIEDDSKPTQLTQQFDAEAAQADKIVATIQAEG